jgi:hypothetical protein
MPRYTGFIDEYKVVHLYILICTEYSPVYTQYNIAFFSFSFPYEKSKAILQYISRYTQTYIISRGCPGSQLRLAAARTKDAEVALDLAAGECGSGTQPDGPDLA